MCDRFVLVGEQSGEFPVPVWVLNEVVVHSRVNYRAPYPSVQMKDLLGPGVHASTIVRDYGCLCPTGGQIWAFGDWSRGSPHNRDSYPHHLIV